MGDRFVVGFQDGKDEPIVYLYSHWGGSERRETLVKSLDKARSRWSDSSYANRIVISNLVGNDWSQELGYGISVNNYAYPDYDDIFIVRWHSQEVDTCETDNPETVLTTESLSDFVTNDTKNSVEMDLTYSNPV